MTELYMVVSLLVFITIFMVIPLYFVLRSLSNLGIM